MADYPITDYLTIPADRPMSFGELLLQAKAFGVDRLAAVLRESPGEQPGIFLVLIGRKAQVAILPHLDRLFKTSNVPDEASHILNLDNKQSIAWAFKWMARNNLRVATNVVKKCPGFNVDVVVVIMHGLALCAPAAPLLTSLDCKCSLT
jgi:hypothetical protein